MLKEKKSKSISERIKLLYRSKNISRNPRKALSDLKCDMGYQEVAECIHELKKKRITERLFASNPFPSDLARVKQDRTLAIASIEIETLWTALVLKDFAEQINQFIELRDLYYKEFIYGNFDQARERLEQVEHKFGHSLWLICSKIECLQKLGGLAAQKAFLQETIKNKRIHPFVALTAYFFSASLEEGTSLTDIAKQIDDLPNIIADYFRHQVCPFQPALIVNPAHCIAHEETSPIIDRYQTLVAMMRIDLTRQPHSRPKHIIEALNSLHAIHDTALSTMRQFLLADQNTEVRIDASLLKAEDTYIEGNYAESVARYADFLKERVDGSSIEKLVRAAAHGELVLDVFPQNSPINALAQYLWHAITATQRPPSSALAYSELVFSFRHQNLALHLTSFESRDPLFAVNKKYTEDEAVWALTSYVENTWNIDVLSAIFDAPDLASSILRRYENSTALQLHNAISLPPLEATEIISLLKVPEGRRALYLGHNRRLAGQPHEASVFYQKALQTTTRAARNTALRFLFLSLLAEGRVADCASLIVTNYFAQPETLTVFDVRALLLHVKANSDSSVYSVELAIVIELYSRSHGREFDPLLSDVFEYSLTGLGVDRPSSIQAQSASHDRAALLFFLRHISNIRNLEDCANFLTYDDVEKERIAVLQSLLKDDPDRTKEYADEIRAITKSAETARLMTHVDQSRIYVDEAAVLAGIDSTMRAIFAKFQSLADLPETGISGEAIAKEFRKLFKDKHADVKHFTLPATEREGLFQKLYETALDSFVHNLDVYLSTRIRHGALEGALRNSMSRRHFVFIGDEAAARIAALGYWTPRVALKGSALDKISLAIAQFSFQVTSLISDLKRNVIRVPWKPGEQGLFNFEVNNIPYSGLIARIPSDATYEQFIAVLFEYLWQQTEKCLTDVREHLNDQFKTSVTNAMTVLATVISKHKSEANILELQNSVAQMRTEFLNDLNRVSEWFHRKQSPQFQPISLEAIAEVTVKVVRNCFPDYADEPTISVPSGLMVKGVYLEAIVDILFICIQNAIGHCGFRPGSDPQIELLGTITDGDLVLSVKNTIAPDADVATIAAKLETAMQNCNKPIRSSSREQVRGEGGSGLFKIHRILTHDMNAQPDFLISLGPDKVVTALIKIGATGVLAC